MPALDRCDVDRGQRSEVRRQRLAEMESLDYAEKGWSAAFSRIFK